MLFRTISLVIIIAFVAPVVKSTETFNLCPEGMFADDSGVIKFSKRPYTSDFQLKLPDEKDIKFSGPIFPVYNLPKNIKSNVDSATQTLTFEQYCKKVQAKVEQKFKLVNGGILADISYKLESGSLTKPAMYRIFLPLDAFAGKSITIDGKNYALPKDKSSNYIISTGSGNKEFRMPVSGGLEVGIKFISGIGSYTVADCRHHGKPESLFHVYCKMDGTVLKYYMCLLKPGEPFPSLTRKMETTSMENDYKKSNQNMLGNGSGFEVGPHGFMQVCAYSWNEAWSDPATPPVFDSITVYDGRFSICLTADDLNDKRGRFNKNAVKFLPVKLSADKTYTLSAWMKSDIPGTKACLDCAEDVWSGATGKTVVLTERWQRYSFTFQPKKFKMLNYCYAWIGVHPKMSKGKVWIDNVQLEAGEEAGVYRPEPMEFGALVDQPYKLFTLKQSKTATVRLFFRNNTENEKSATLNYTIKDYWDKVVKQGKISLTAAGKSNDIKEVKIPELPCGYYRATFNNSDKTLHDEVIFGIYEPMQYTGKLPFNWPLGCDNSEAPQVVRDLGFGWVRCWNFSFKRVCPEEGKFNFKETDIIVERCRKSNLNLMPILGPAFSRAFYDKEGNPFVPEWAIQTTRKSSINTSYLMNISLPRIDAWKTYVHAVVSRYKNQIKAWEVMNEPNCWLTPEEYTPYLQATYEAAKKADPDCVIVGVCSTSDWGGSPAPWTSRVIELDKCKSLDVLSIHMYNHNAPELFKGIGTNRMIEILKEKMKEYGKNLPVWHTEKSYNTTKMGYSQKKLKVPPIYLKEPMFRVPDFRAKTEFLIREALLDSTTGKGPYFWFGKLPNDIYIIPRSRVYGLGHTEYDGSPCPEVIAANGLARMLEGRSNPQELIKLGATRYCALYEGDKGSLAALWDSEGKSMLKLPGSADSYKIYNLFGTAVPATTQLEFGTAPLYLVFDGKKAAEVKALLLKSEVSGEKLSISGGLEQNKNSVGLAIYAFNKAFGTLKPEVKLTGTPDNWKFTDSKKKAVCKQDEYTRMFFPVKLPAKSEFPVILEVFADSTQAKLAIPPYSSLNNLWSVLSDSKSVETEQVKPGMIKIDGKLDEWSDNGLCGAATAEKVKSGRKRWTDPMNLSVSARFRWNSDKLYIAAVVYDDMLERNCSAKNAYNSDCLELFIGLEPDSRSKAKNSKDIKKTGKYDYQFLFAPGVKGGKYPNATAWCCQLKSSVNIEIASSQFQYGYILEAAIPWKSIKKDYVPVKGSTLLMTFQVQDADGAGEPSRMCIFWSGDGSNWMSTEKWGSLTLK
ncbi:MAG: hypothetical protein JXR78_00125 [Victivallales bacterium]|nr:hypothetical protein [Victivallales bacterium]